MTSSDCGKERSNSNNKKKNRLPGRSHRKTPDLCIICYLYRPNVHADVFYQSTVLILGCDLTLKYTTLLAQMFKTLFNFLQLQYFLKSKVRVRLFQFRILKTPQGQVQAFKVRLNPYSSSVFPLNPVNLHCVVWRSTVALIPNHSNNAPITPA